MQKRFNRIFTKEEFQRTFYQGGTPLTYVDGIITSGQWTFLSTEECAYLDAPSLTNKMFVLNIGKLQLGDKIEVSAEFLNISGLKGKISIDCHYTDGTSETIFITSTNGNQFEKTTFILPVQKEGTFIINLGLSYVDFGIFKVRNIMIDIHTIEPREVKLIRHLCIKGTESGYEVDTRWSKDTATVTVNGLDLQVDFTQFANNTRRSLTVVTDAAYTHTKYKLTAIDSIENSVKIRIYDTETNTNINWLDLPNKNWYYFNLLNIAYVNEF